MNTRTVPKCSLCEINERARINAETRQAGAYALYHTYYMQCRALDKGMKRLHRKIARLEKQLAAPPQPVSNKWVRIAGLIHTTIRNAIQLDLLIGGRQNAAPTIINAELLWAKHRTGNDANARMSKENFRAAILEATQHTSATPDLSNAEARIAAMPPCGEGVILPDFDSLCSKPSTSTTVTLPSGHDMAAARTTDLTQPSAPSTLPLTRETINMLDMACNEETFNALRKQALRAIELERQVAKLCLPPSETLSQHPGCVFCMEAGTPVRPGQVCPKCGDRLPTEREYEANRLEQQVAEQDAELAEIAHTCEGEIKANETLADKLEKTEAAIAEKDREIARLQSEIASWLEREPNSALRLMRERAEKAEAKLAAEKAKNEAWDKTYDQLADVHERTVAELAELRRGK